MKIKLLSMLVLTAMLTACSDKGQDEAEITPSSRSEATQEVINH